MRRSAANDASRDSAPPHSEPRGVWLRWALCGAVNLLVGCLGTVPFGLTVRFVLTHPLAGLGLMTRDPTDNDGVLPWLIVLTVLLTVFAALWFLVNLGMRRGFAADLRRYWLVSAGITLVPTFVLAIAAL